MTKTKRMPIKNLGSKDTPRECRNYGHRFVTTYKQEHHNLSLDPRFPHSSFVAHKRILANNEGDPEAPNMLLYAKAKKSPGEPFMKCIILIRERREIMFECTHTHVLQNDVVLDFKLFHPFVVVRVFSF